MHVCICSMSHGQCQASHLIQNAARHRAGQIQEAVDFAKSTLSPLRGLLSSRQAASDAMLHEVMGLVCYENPMVSCRHV